MATAEVPVRRGLADVLGLIAAPAFLAMAALAVAEGDRPPFPLCSGHGNVFGLSGMVPMYLLMTVIHLSPWLKGR